ncbi:MAG: hypothetical protein Q7R22_006895 [Verrucomicrobiota bacterium JB025]|nr:hypothetical protein [Verrucomicrobiota bacterium JB025]
MPFLLSMTILRILLTRTWLLAALALPSHAGPFIDSIQFGNETNEAAHALKVQDSTVITGAHDLPARQFLPSENMNWRGGRIWFTMKVDPARQNYFTAKFWGGDLTGEHSRLMLFIDGKQIGQRHLGEVDQLDIMYNYPRFPGNFFYKTTPLPINITEGRDSVELRIEAQGPIWGYGGTPDRYQKPMAAISRGIYAGHVHTDPFYQLTAEDRKSATRITFPTRNSPGPEMLETVKKRINTEIAKLTKSDKQISPDAIRFLAKACFEPWSDAYHRKPVLKRILKGIDDHYLAFKQNPEISGKDWHGSGPLAHAVCFLETPLSHYLDQPITGTNTSRRNAWADMFEFSRNTKVGQRRSYTNQSMIVDMNIYFCDRALRILDPSRAWSKGRALRLLHEAAGIKPWSGSWDENGNPSWKLGKNHLLLTEQGLTKELGFVGHYGEIVTGMLLDLYDSTRPAFGEEGDPKLKEQLIRMTKARGIFRYPLPDGQGFRSMHIETVIGWRDWYYPGGTTYEQMATESPLDVAAATLDPEIVGYGQQMLEDNQYFKALEKRLTLRGINPLSRLLAAPRNYELVKSRPKHPQRLPMTPGQPDFVFADPEIGTVALKHGDDIMFVSLYWRARYAINNLARVHHITPTTERDATVHIRTHFNDSGLVFEFPDITNMPFSTRMEGYYKAEHMHMAVTGIKQPIAKVPADQIDWKPGRENSYAGKGWFYLMEYGPYLIAMNCTRDQSFPFPVAQQYIGGKDLATGQRIDSATWTARPWQTLVIHRKP